jgi:DNA-binding NtrC family response regulator
MPGRARIVCSSSVNIQTAIRQGRVIERLLGGFGHRVTLLPLRERTEDIPELCEYLIEKFARSFSRPVPRLGPDLLEVFKRRTWPGNIRELENQIARIVIFGPDEAIGHDVQEKAEVRQGLVRRHRGMRGKGDVRRLPDRFS